MLLADVRPIKDLFEFYNTRIFARDKTPQRSHPAGRIDDLEEDFQQLMRDFTNLEVADDGPDDGPNNIGDAELNEVAEVPNGTAPVIDSRSSSRAPPSATGRTGARTQPIRGGRTGQAKAPKGNTRPRDDIEDSELDKAPKRQTKSRRK